MEQFISFYEQSFFPNLLSVMNKCVLNLTIFTLVASTRLKGELPGTNLIDQSALSANMLSKLCSRLQHFTSRLQLRRPPSHSTKLLNYLKVFSCLIQCVM